jgi:DMSO/TMAO reductase YedYZ molybdopterin-dependent catalytic subunit
MNDQPISRRKMILGGATVLGGLFLARGKLVLAPTYANLLGLGDALSFSAHRMLLPGHSLAREYSRGDISPFPANGTINPEDAAYQQMLKGGFADFRVSLSGMVAQPLDLSLADLKRYPSRTQITQQTCEEGWSAIGEWTGVQLSRVLTTAGIKPEARFLVFYCVDGWWDCIDLADALHPQTMLAYGMNGRDLPVPHGAPVRLRVERQLGYKSLKFVNRIVVTDRIDNVEDGKGASGVRYGYSWYGGI